MFKLVTPQLMQLAESVLLRAKDKGNDQSRKTFLQLRSLNEVQLYHPFLRKNYLVKGCSF